MLPYVGDYSFSEM